MSGGTYSLKIRLLADQARPRVGEGQRCYGYSVGARGIERSDVLAAVVRPPSPLFKRYARVIKCARNVGNRGVCEGT